MSKINFTVGLIFLISAFLFQNCGPGFSLSQDQTFTSSEQSGFLTSSFEIIDDNNRIRLTEQAKSRIALVMLG